MSLQIDTVRPLKAKAIGRCRNQYAVESDALRHVTVRDATVLPLRRCENSAYEYGCGGVVDADGRYVGLSAGEDRIGGAYPVGPEEKTENKKVVYCGYFNPQWGHFLFESLSRLWFLFEKENTAVDEFIFITDSDMPASVSPGSNHAEVFRLLGIADRIRIVSRPVRFSEVIVPQESFVLTKRINESFSLVFDRIRSEVVSGKESETGLRIFLGRSSFPKARKYEIGIADMENHFRKNGYMVVYPEQIPLKDLISLMNRSEEIVTFSGSVAHNLLFAPAGSKVTVIEKFPYVNYFQTAVDISRRLDVAYVDANAFVRPVDVGLGPFIICFNRYFSAYCQSRGLSVPEETAVGRQSEKRLHRFLLIHNREYGSGWRMPGWLGEFDDLMEEAFSDSKACYSEADADNLWFRFRNRFSFYRIVRSIYRFFR